MENNKNKKSVKFQGGMLYFYDFIQVFVLTTNHHLKTGACLIKVHYNEFSFFGNWQHACLIQDACLIEVATKTGPGRY